MTVQVLVAPAGTRFSPEAGSEDGWIYDIVSGVSALDPTFWFTCMTEQSDGAMPDGIRLVTVGRRQTEEFGGLLLPFRLSQAVKSVGPLGKFDVVHHALPFAAGRSFSLLTAQACRHGLPVVIGPMQTPLEWTGSDEDGGQLVVGGHRTMRRAATTAARVVMPAAAAVVSRLSAATLRRADRVVVVGRPAGRLAESAGVEPQRIEIIPPPTRLIPMVPMQHAQGGGPLRLVTAGYLIERKAVGDIVTVVADLAAGGDDVVLDVAGDGPAAGAVRELARRHRGGRAIRFHGWLDQARLGELIRSADGYVSMSRGESWGQALADALAASLVVVSTDNAGARSMAELGAPLRRVPVGDRTRLADELRRLCYMDRAVLREEGVAGARWAAKHLAASVVADRWATLYRQVRSEGGRRPPGGVAKGGARRGTMREPV